MSWRKNKIEALLNTYTTILTGRGTTALWALLKTLRCPGAGVLVAVNVCEVVVAEILQGAVDEREWTKLAGELGALVCLSMEGVGERAGQLALQLRRRGLSIPTTDLLIVATAQMHKAALLHRDQHLTRAAVALGLQTLEP